jgi:hypothetical protein
MTVTPAAAGIVFDSDAALQSRPALAADIAIINAIWAEIELFLGLLLAVILGEDARLGTTIYLALHTEGPQREVIKASASMKLAPDDAKKVELILDRVRNGAMQRNRVCHGLWGYSEAHPNILFLTDKKDVIKFYGHVGLEMNLGQALSIIPSMTQYDQPKLRVVQGNLRRVLKDLHAMYHDFGEPGRLFPAKPQTPNAAPDRG